MAELVTKHITKNSVFHMHKVYVEAAACEGDIGGDGYVDVSDLLTVIDQWGATKSKADINMDGNVNVTDLLIIVGNWGPCD
jgi:hypothetical protein